MSYSFVQDGYCVYKDLEQVLRAQLLCNTTASVLPGHVRALLSIVCLWKKGDIKDQLTNSNFVYKTNKYTALQTMS